MAFFEDGGDALRRSVERLARGADAVFDQAAEAFAHFREAVMQGIALNRDDLMQPVAGFRKPARKIFAARGNRIGDLGSSGVKPFGQGVGAHAKIGGEDFAGGLEPILHFRQTLRERLRDAVAGGGEIDRGVVSCLRQSIDEFGPVGGQVIDEIVPAAVQGGFNVFSLRAERSGDSPGRLADAFCETGGGGFEIAGNRVMRDRNRAAHAIGIGEDGLALGRQFVDQRADAALIIRIGALQIGDFGTDQGFEFACPRERALDPVSHRGDLAADGLRQGHHLFGGDGFGFGEADRDLGHRAGGHPHFLGALDHHRDDEEEDGGAGDRQEIEHRRRQQGARGQAEKRFPVGDEIAEGKHDPEA